MQKVVAVLDADQEQCRKLCDALKKENYQTIAMNSVERMEKYLRNQTCEAVIIDLDTIRVDNQAIRGMKTKCPGTHFLCLSNNRFHPHLKESLGYHIYACVHKPVDLDELFYWLKSIYQNGSDLQVSPGN